MKSMNISTDKLQQWLQAKEPVFILDVRPEKDRKEWHIPESVHLDAYQRLKKGDFKVLDEIVIPENVPVVTVCAAGKTSQIAAEVLRNKGMEAYSLEGGMKAWNYAWNTAEMQLPGTDVTIIQVQRVAKGCLSYIIGSGKEAVVVDASLDPEVYLKIAEDHKWTIRYVMDTHIHADYLSRTRELATQSGARHLFIEQAGVDFPFHPVKNQEEIAFGVAKLKILHTPGHTPESTSYLINEQTVLTGDTLFTDGVGRPDLKADKEEALKKATQLYDSLQRLLSLAPETVVLPAHISHAIPFDGKMVRATLGELKGKLELLSLPKASFIETTLKRIPSAPPNYLTIASLNKQGSFEGYHPADLEAGANRCAVA